MHYFLLPMLPLTLAGALFFKKRIAAYGFPVVLTLVKMLLTAATPTYFYSGLGLIAVVFLIRRVNRQDEISLVKVAGYTISGVILFELFSNFGVWVVGGCVPGERHYALNFSGLFACYKAALPYAGTHLVKAIPASLVLVQAFQWLKNQKIGFVWQRLFTAKMGQ